MKRKFYVCIEIALYVALAMALAGCGESKADPRDEAPPAPTVEHIGDLNVVQAEHPEQFPLVAAGMRTASSELVVNGVVSPDISRTVPVVSLAAGRVAEIHARLGDTVKKGQLLLRVQSSDVSAAFSDYKKAIADETLARTQLDRAKDLNAHGATSVNELQVAQDTEDKAKVDVETAMDRLRLLGADPAHPSGFADLLAPVSGVITDQQVANAGGVQALGSNPFTISDLSRVWIVCDVYENDLPMVRVGDPADIRLNAYPGRVFKGTVSNIGAVLDPTLRSAKVRIEVANPGQMRVGMFVNATFHGLTKESHAVVPATAILHLHDRDWVFLPAPGNKFRRVEVTSGATLPDNAQEILSGILPGQQVVSNALVLEDTVEQ